MEWIKIEQINKVIKEKPALSNIDLVFHKNENTAIIGETGSGKSTLLKAIAGLVQPDTGKISLNGKKILGPEEKLIPGHHHIAYLSQYYELPIHLRVEQALEYANTLDPEDEQALYKICHIEHLMKRKTHELSGGEKQRIALVRLLLGKPQILLLDEPFSNFDNIHKNEMMQMVHEAAQKWDITCIMVSHMPKDVLAWADRIIVMKNSEVVQDGTPEEVYHTPKNEYVAGLLGDFNLFSKETLFKIGIEDIVESRNYIVRPESLHVVMPDAANLKGRIQEKHFLGFGYLLEVDIQQTLVKIFTQYQFLQKGDTVYLQLHHNDIIVI